MELSRPSSPIFSCRDDRPIPVTDTTIGQNGYFYPESCQVETFEWFSQQTELDENDLVALRSNGKAISAKWSYPGYGGSFFFNIAR